MEIIPIFLRHGDRVSDSSFVVFYQGAAGIIDFIDQGQIITGTTVGHGCDIAGKLRCGIAAVALPYG